MLRVWIVSGLVVAAVVAAILILTHESDPDPGRAANGGREQPPPARRSLTERDVRTYLAVMPEIQARLGEIAAAMQRGGQPIGGHRERIAAILRGHHLTMTDWQRLRKGVEGAVEAYRWELGGPERTKQREQTIREKEALLESAEGPLRARIESDLATLRAEQESPFPPLHDEDRTLVKRFWNDLDQSAPKSAPALPRR